MIKIYGASDDLIEIEGEIRDEFNVSLDDSYKGVVLAVSDGTLLRVVYDADGIWRITLTIGGLADFTKIEGSVEFDTPDIATITGPTIKWVVLGKTSAAAIYRAPPKK